MTIAWVVGSHGLLGSALCRKLTRIGSELLLLDERFDWCNESVLALQLTSAIQAFSSLVGDAKGWEIYWAAGVGNMSSSAGDLIPETRALALLLRLVESDPRLVAKSGAMAFASSAGAIYAGSPDYLINENSLPAPNTAYAREKIVQEDLVRSFTLANSHMTALLARLSTLYGPNQSTGKRQGLLAYVARCMLTNQPIQIYVPFDTIRDYIAADDAATMMISTLRAISEPGVCIKIMASEQPTTIVYIISNFKRVVPRTPRIVTSASKLSNIYSRRMLFRSIVLPEFSRTPKISLPVGIAQLMAAERAAFVRGPRATTK